MEEHFQLFLLMVRKKLDCAKESVKNVKQYQSASSALLDISITKENVVYVILNAKHAWIQMQIIAQVVIREVF